jgi:uncharacterized protein (TIGR02246 family)
VREKPPCGFAGFSGAINNGLMPAKIDSAVVVSEEKQIRSIYQGLLDSWNRRSAEDMAALFAGEGYIVGFDGSLINGQEEIREHLRPIFANHPTAAYVTKVKSVRFLTPEVAVLNAVVGMVPPGQSDINPAVNAVQTMVAARQDRSWRIAVFQNTPAAFHGRPEETEKLTQELREVLHSSQAK